MLCELAHVAGLNVLSSACKATAHQALGLLLQLVQHRSDPEALLQALLVTLCILLVLCHYAALQALYVLVAACSLRASESSFS